MPTPHDEDNGNPRPSERVYIVYGAVFLILVAIMMGIALFY